jgi:hypothetical protein
MLITAIVDQTNPKIFFERITSQAPQKISWFRFERKALEEPKTCSTRYAGGIVSRFL